MSDILSMGLYCTALHEIVRLIAATASSRDNVARENQGALG